MEKLVGFTFYKNYYELIKYLPNKERLQLYDAIMQYMYNDNEVQLKGLINGIWINIKMVLDKSKMKTENGKKGGRPKNQNETKIKPNEKQNETKMKPKEKQKETKAKANNIYYFLFIISNFLFINNNKELKDKIIEYLEYKEERKEYYKEKGMNSLLVQIEKKAKEYGTQNVIDLITECMANNWKGIIWDKIKKEKKENLPEWFDEKIENKTSKDEEKEIKKLLEEFE